jgi:ubiquinone/menaquinone biosynthesis C-methylase UbiE
MCAKANSMSRNYILDFVETYRCLNGVYQLTDKLDFEGIYLCVRGQEGRILSDREVSSLPETLMDTPYQSEWRIRTSSANRFLSYITTKSTRPTSMLDLGCGNGWFSKLLSSAGDSLLGLDINQQELEQAARLFSGNTVRFAYGDIYKVQWEAEAFDLITLNASVQYFKNLPMLLDKLLQLLRPGGEIHIIDSIFYPKAEVNAAQRRSEMYYENISAKEMSTHYAHHCLEDLEAYDHQLLYNPQDEALREKNADYSPLYWIVLYR